MPPKRGRPKKHEEYKKVTTRRQHEIQINKPSRYASESEDEVLALTPNETDFESEDTSPQKKQITKTTRKNHKTAKSSKELTMIDTKTAEQIMEEFQKLANKFTDLQKSIQNKTATKITPKRLSSTIVVPTKRRCMPTTSQYDSDEGHSNESSPRNSNPHTPRHTKPQHEIDIRNQLDRSQFGMAATATANDNQTKTYKTKEKSYNDDTDFDVNSQHTYTKRVTTSNSNLSIQNNKTSPTPPSTHVSFRQHYNTGAGGRGNDGFINYRHANNDCTFNLEADLPKNKGKKFPLFYPNMYLKRGTKGYKVGPGEAEPSEYLWAVDRMTYDRDVPSSWKNHLKRHLSDLLKMWRNYSWEQCRDWSEAVFTQIQDGQLEDGWENYQALINLQQATLTRPKSYESKYKSKPWVKETNATPYTQKETPITYTHNIRENVFNRQNEAPCYRWNFTTCNLTPPHHEECRRHICSYCSKVLGTAANHKEPDCDKKQFRKTEKNFQ